MNKSTFTGENWIEFEGKRYRPEEFITLNQQEPHKTIASTVNFLKDWYSDQVFILQKTSGSTGKPKIIRLDKQQIKASALATLETLNLKAGQNALLCINPDYIGGKMMIARALLGNLNLSIAPATGNPLQNYHMSEPIDFFSFVPYQIEKIIDESSSLINFLDDSTAIILGGAPVSGGLRAKIKTKFKKTKVYSTYGMTETVSHVALELINSTQKEAFKALKNIKFSVDTRNCLIVHAPEISGQDTLVTNDVVELLSPTEFYWLGRYDFVINSGGIKIHPEILEKEISILLEKENLVNRFFVFALPDKKLGESVNMIIEGECDRTKIYTLLKENLPDFQAPKKIYGLEEFIETENGKLNRKSSIQTVINA